MAKYRQAFSRGQFARVKTWEELTSNHPVYRDGSGEYTRFCTGVSIRRDNPALSGETGVIVGVSPDGLHREMWLRSGVMVKIPFEVLERITA